MFDATDGGPAVADVEALAQRLYMSDPDGGFGHGAWDAEDCLRPAVKDRFREFAKNLLLPCEKCPPMPALGPPSLPEPDVNNPEQCRFVSEVSRRLEPEVADGYADWERGLTAREWGQRADRLEREQAAKTAQDHLVEQVTATVVGTWVGHAVGAEPIVTALLDRFDITPKSADAGLLREAGEQ